MLVVLMSILLNGKAIAVSKCDPEMFGSSPPRRQAERYEDFFQNQKEKEKREALRQKGREEVHGQREYRRVQEKRARLEYKRSVRDKAREERLRVEWEKGQEARLRSKLALEGCYGDMRRKQGARPKHGRSIPELQEFDLQDY